MTVTTCPSNSFKVACTQVKDLILAAVLDKNGAIAQQVQFHFATKEVAQQFFSQIPQKWLELIDKIEWDNNTCVNFYIKHREGLDAMDKYFELLEGVLIETGLTMKSDTNISQLTNLIL